MEANFQLFLILIAVLAGTALLARRIDVAPAILLLLAGIALAFVPGMPTPELPPELVLLFVLPPLIYSAAVAMSAAAPRSQLRTALELLVHAGTARPDELTFDQVLIRRHGAGRLRAEAAVIPSIQGCQAPCFHPEG